MNQQHEYEPLQDKDADEARHRPPIAAPAAQDPGNPAPPARRGRGRPRKHRVDHSGANANTQAMISEFRNEFQTRVATTSSFFQETEQGKQRLAGIKRGRGRPRKYAQAPLATTTVVPVATARATRGTKRTRRAGPSISTLSLALPAHPSDSGPAFPVPHNYMIPSESEEKEEAENQAASDSPDRTDESSGDSDDDHQAVSESEDDDAEGHVAWTDVEVGQHGISWP